MSRSGFLFLFAVAMIAVACRGPKEPPAPAAESRGAPTETRPVTIDRIGRLLKVISATGETTTGVAPGVRLIRDGRDVTPQLGIELKEGDRLVTDGATRAVIGSDVASEISLRPNSDLTIRRASGFLNLGSLFVSIKRLFRVETKFVVAGVEGTEFALSVDPSEVTAVAVLEGSVRVESRVERWSPRSYRAGEQCQARGTAEPEKRALDDRPGFGPAVPRAGWTREQLLRWRQDLGSAVP